MITLLNGVTATGAGAGVAINTPPEGSATFQAVVAGTGVVQATVNVEVSNNNTDWEVAATISLNGTTRAHDGFSMSAPWAYVRGNVTAISGTGAAVTLTKGL